MRKHLKRLTWIVASSLLSLRQVAARYGDPEELLTEDWTPQIPGITSQGSYDEYAKDPAAWIYRREA